MAVIDYGSIVKKNGVIVQKEIFMDMEKAVGFTIDKLYCRHLDTFTNVNDGFFSYMGDKDFLICVFKTQLWLIEKKEIKKIIWYGTDDGSIKLPYKKYALSFNFNGIDFTIKRLFSQNRYKLRFWYKNDLYECLYGYGVDIDKNAWYNVSPKEKRFLNRWFAVNDTEKNNKKS